MAKQSQLRFIDPQPERHATVSHTDLCHARFSWYVRGKDGRMETLQADRLIPDDLIGKGVTALKTPDGFFWCWVQDL